MTVPALAPVPVPAPAGQPPAAKAGEEVPAGEFADLVATLLAGGLPAAAGQEQAADETPRQPEAGTQADAAALAALAGTVLPVADATAVATPGAPVASGAGPSAAVGPDLPVPAVPVTPAPVPGPAAAAPDAEPQMPAAPVTDVPGPAATSGPAAGTPGGARADVADASSTAPGRPAWTDGRAAGLDGPPAPAPHGPVVAAPTEPRRDDRSPTAAVGLVTPAAGVSAAAPPAAVAGSTPPGPGAPAHLAGQLVPAVSAIHRVGADGTHRVTVDVTPEELGPVRLTVEMRSGEMNLLLAGSSETSREALRAALPELRRMLDAAGMTTGQLDVRPDDLGSRPAWSDLSGGLPQGETGRGGSTGSDRASRTGGPAAGEGDVPSHVTRPDHDNSLDVRI